MTKDFVAAVVVAIVSSSVWPVVLPRVLERKNRKRHQAEARHRADEARNEHNRDEWMRDSAKAYERVSNECQACRKELERLRREEIEPLKRDCASLKEALLSRIEALDEILPYVTNLPPERLDELRRVNRAQRRAAFQADW